jgi:hypothetical protein
LHPPGSSLKGRPDPCSARSAHSVRRESAPGDSRSPGSAERPAGRGGGGGPCQPRPEVGCGT